MIIPLWPINVWLWTLGLAVLVLVVLAAVALFRSYYHLRSHRWDEALTMFGLYVGFLAVAITIVTVWISFVGSELTTHRHNCIMYELALQRNANPDLPNVTFDPAWEALECYNAP